MTKTVKCCSWAGDDPAMQHYHDTEWGVPLHDDRALFEFLVLEGAQAGLSWSTVLQLKPACAPSSTRNSNNARSSCSGTPHSVSW